MQEFTITVVNDEFVSQASSALPDAAQAREQALRSALEVGSEQMLTGKPFFAAEVIVDGTKTRERFVVSIGVSALK